MTGRLPAPPERYDVRDQRELRRAVETVSVQIDSRASQARDRLDRVLTRDDTVKTGVDATADIAGTVAGYVAKAQHGIFLEPFETAPDDWNDRTALGSFAIETGGQTGGHVLRCAGWVWRAFPFNVPFASDKLFRIRVKARQINNPSGAPVLFYAGVEGVAEDGVALVNTAGADVYTSQHYVAANGVAMPADSTWQTFTGWFKGRGTPAPSGDPLTPSPLHADVRYLRPVFMVSAPTVSGQDTSACLAEIDSIAIDVLDEDAITRAYTALASNGDLNRGASGSVAAETLASMVGADPSNLITNGGGQAGAVAAQAPGWTYGAGSALVVASDAAQFGDRSLGIDAAVAADNYSYQDFALQAGEVARVSGWIKGTGIAGAGFGAILNLDMVGQTDAAAFELLDFTGSQPTGAGPHVGGGTGTYAFTFVQMVVRALVAGTARLYAQLGFNGTCSGTARFDGIRVEKLGPNVAIGGSRANQALDANARLKSQTRTPMLTSGGPRSVQVDGAGNVLVSVLSSNGATITVATHTLRLGTDEAGAAVSIAYTSGLVTGVSSASPGTLNHVYRDDPSYSGAGTYIATTNKATLFASRDRYYVGSVACITGTPSSGGGGGGGSNPPNAL